MYGVSGNITKVISEELGKQMTKSFEGVKYRSRILGYDITLETGDIEMYLTSFDEKEFDIDILCFMQKEKFLSFLNQQRTSIEPLKYSQV